MSLPLHCTTVDVCEGPSPHRLKVSLQSAFEASSLLGGNTLGPIGSLGCAGHRAVAFVHEKDTVPLDGSWGHCRITP